MAEGFKKHFNSSTLRGRANVAKATYATFALIYLIYRVRRGSGKKPTDDGRLMAESKESSCNCDREREPIEPDSGVYEADPECAACRERAERAMTEYDREQQRRSAQEEEAHEESCNGYSNPPPPPPPPAPPSGGAESASPTPRRKCPCDEGHSRKQEAAPVRTSQTRVRIQQPQHQYATASVPSEIQQARPVSVLIGQVHEAVYQALRTVVAAVMGGTSASPVTGSNPNQTNQEDCGCNSINYATTNANAEDGPVRDQKNNEIPNDADVEGKDEKHEDEMLLPRRTAPRSCVPTGGEDPRQQKPSTDANQNKESEHYHHSFSDGFAADMYFESADE